MIKRQTQTRNNRAALENSLKVLLDLHGLPDVLAALAFAVNVQSFKADIVRDDKAQRALAAEFQAIKETETRLRLLRSKEQRRKW